MSDFLTIQTTKALKKTQTKLVQLIERLPEAINKEADQCAKKITFLTGIPEARLTEICNGSTADAKELHALSNAIEYLDYDSDDKREYEIANKSHEAIMKYMLDIMLCSDPEEIFRGFLKLSGEDTLEAFFASYHIFLAADSLCNEMMESFLDLVLPLIKESEKPLKFIVPKTVVDSITNLSTEKNDSEDEEKSLAAVGLRNINRLENEGLLSVRGDEVDATVMSTFISALARYKPVNNLLLLTQDMKLSSAVRFLNNSGIEGDEILCFALNEDRLVQDWYFRDREDDLLDPDGEFNEDSEGEDLFDDIPDEDLNEEDSEDEDLFNDISDEISLEGSLDESVSDWDEALDAASTGNNLSEESELVSESVSIKGNKPENMN